MTALQIPLSPQAGLVTTAFWILCWVVSGSQRAKLWEVEHWTKHAPLSSWLPRDRVGGRNWGWRSYSCGVAYSSLGGFKWDRLFQKAAQTAWATALVVKWSGFLKVRRALTPSVLEVLPVPSVLFCALISWTTSAFLGFLRTFPLATQN